MKSSLKNTLGLLFFGLFSSVAKGALAINALEVEHHISFDASVPDVLNGQFTGTGFANNPTAGQLDSDSWSTQGWGSGGSVAFGGTATVGEFARGSTGSPVASTGIYSYGTSDRQLLLQPGNTPAFNGESITLKLQNNTGLTITGWTISYENFRRNDSNTDSFLVADLSSDGISWVIPAVEYATFLMPSGSFSDALGWTQAPTQSHTFDSNPNLVVNDGDFFFIRWRTYLTSGSQSSPRDEWGIDDIRITAIPEPGTAILSIFLAASLLIRRNR